MTTIVAPAVNIDTKTTRVVSKNGKVYYKNNPEYNRNAQHIHYQKIKLSILSDKILERVATQGTIPQLKSLDKFPDLITPIAILKAFYKWSAEQDDLFMVAKKEAKLKALFKLKNDLELNKIDV